MGVDTDMPQGCCELYQHELLGILSDLGPLCDFYLLFFL